MQSKDKWPDLVQYDLVVDALLGIGLKGYVQGISPQWITQLNSQRPDLLALDIPSALCSYTGYHCGWTVHADFTVNFIGRK